MRNAIGGAWLFGLVAIFIVIFSSFLAISINYYKAFEVKNSIINILEKYEGYNHVSVEVIDSYLAGAGYNNYGRCKTGEMAGTTDSVTGKSKYCVKSIPNEYANETIDYKYYQVRVFFKMDLPVLGNILNFSVPGESKPVYLARDDFSAG